MKICQLLFLLVASVQAFVVQQQQQPSTRSSSSSSSSNVLVVLQMGWFEKMVKPMHGGGSADENELDEIWKTQQAILAARKGETKEHMRQKYKDQRAFDVKATMPIGKMDDTYVEDNDTNHKRSPKKAVVSKSTKKAAAFKMPWEK